MENVNRIFSPIWAIYPSKPPLTLPDTPNKVILGSFGTRRLTTASFSHFYQLPKTSPPDIVDSLKKLLLICTEQLGTSIKSTGCAGVRDTISRKQQAQFLSKPISFEKAREEGLPHEGLRSATSILISLDFLPCHISRRRLQRDHRSRCNSLHLWTPPCVGISLPSFPSVIIQRLVRDC